MSPNAVRQYPPEVLRRVAFITVGQSLGLSLAEIGAALAELPAGHNPNKRDWERGSRHWCDRMDAQITQMQAVRERLTSCIGCGCGCGCGCLSLRECSLSNKKDRAASLGAGPRYLLGDAPN